MKRYYLKRYSPSNKRMLLIINPVSGKELGKKYAFALISFFTREGFTVTVYPTDADSLKNKSYIAQNAFMYDIIVCCGGDGTLNQTVSGIIASRRNVPLGYIPLGTTNDFARTLKISSNPFKAALAISKGKSKKIDCGIFNGRCFTYIAATGAFTQASYETTSTEKKYLGSLAYMIKGVESLTKLKPFHLKAKVNDKIIEGDYLYTSISNTTSLGGVFKLDPKKVKIDDGLFEFVLIKAPTTLAEKGKLFTSLLKESLNAECVDLYYASEIKIKLTEPMPWTIDGENGDVHKEITVSNVQNVIEFVGI